MKYGQAFYAGVIGGAVLTVALILARLLGLTGMNFEMALGSLITGSVGTGAWALGLVTHLIISGVTGILYGAGFEYVTHRSGWRIGVAFGGIHLILLGILVGSMGAAHPLMVPPPGPPPAGRLLDPGAFDSSFGPVTVTGFVVLHLLYGAIIGGIYEPIRVRVPVTGPREAA